MMGMWTVMRLHGRQDVSSLFFFPDAQQHLFCLNNTGNGHIDAYSVYAFFDV